MPIRITTTVGTTTGVSDVLKTISPSTAESTDIVGVMMPSPNNKPAPAMASMVMMKRPRRACAESPRGINESNAKMPPSPRLEARQMVKMYFTFTTKSSSQNTIERMPRINSSSMFFPDLPRWIKASFNAYSGLVPMSPKTTPMAPMARTDVALSERCCSRGCDTSETASVTLIRHSVAAMVHVSLA